MVAWAVYTTAAYIEAFVISGVSEAKPSLLTHVLFYTVFGLPLAIFTCLLIGFPVWAISERRGLSSKRDAIKVGAVFGAILCFVVMFIQRLMGLREYLDDSFRSQWGGGAYIVSIDGLLTPYGWFLEIIDVAVFLCAGALAGYAAWKVSGLGRTMRNN
ncbi:MAG: hypothetical protein WA979_04745 [Pacificimonas sp.]